MNEPIFQLENTCFSYSEDRLALNNINLDILPDQRLVILGVNGSGKSTLLKLLNGLVFASSGQFRAFGHSVTEELLEKGAWGPRRLSEEDEWVDPEKQLSIHKKRVVSTVRPIMHCNDVCSYRSRHYRLLV